DMATIIDQGSPSTPVQFGRALLEVISQHSALPQYDSHHQLPAGDYRVYVRAGDVGSAGARGPWAHSDFTVEVAPPPSPKVEVQPFDALRARVPLLVRSGSNLLSDRQASSTTSTTDYALTNCTASLVTTAARVWNPPDGPSVTTKALQVQ